MNILGPNFKNLILLGGITLNCEGSDMFVPLKFEIRTKDGLGNADLLEECFPLYKKVLGEK